MASAECEPYNAGLGAEPQRGPRAEHLVRGPLKLVTFLYSKCISCALLVAFCIGATAVNFCKYSTLGKLHRKL